MARAAALTSVFRSTPELSRWTSSGISFSGGVSCISADQRFEGAEGEAIGIGVVDVRGERFGEAQFQRGGGTDAGDQHAAAHVGEEITATANVHDDAPD